MKKPGLLIFTVILSLALFAQEDDFQTIGRHDGFRISGFGGPMMSFTQIGNDFAHMMGGGGGVIINNFFFGGYGMGKTNELAFKNAPAHKMNFGHGGFWFGYTMLYNWAVHPVFHTQVGWGVIDQSLDGDLWDPNLIHDNVFVIAPTAELELNFSRFFKLGGGITYNFVYNTDGPYTFLDFYKPGVFLSFKFGYF
ncbi:MAG: hypothetical protein JXA77_05555 [Bacteroidales bacterium]|nr:hypothetical protein [Bacteroidales bacterium]MBN2818064.1 hypothetical protein [Bacteroidales bacterium]